MSDSGLTTQTRLSGRVLAAWALIILNCALIIGAAALSGSFSVAGFAFLPATFVVVGGVIVLKAGDNVEGWLLLLIGTLWSVSEVTPFEGSWVLPLGLMTTQLLLRFPDGQLPSPRWRWFSNLSLAYLIVSAFIGTCGSKFNEDGTVNPFYLPWLSPLDFLVLFLPMAIIVSVVSLVIRFRHADGMQRQQIRWIAWAAATVTAIYVVVLAASLNSLWGEGAPPVLRFFQNVALLSFCLVPVAIGVAVLKYRLYEIDRLVSRTTSYLLVSGVLVGAYLAVVTLGSHMASGSSSLTVTIATLAVAAAFRPLLRRTQASVDKRFNRERYNAVRTVDLFAKQLREVVDNQVVADRLASAVQGSLQPTQVTLWMSERRPDPVEPIH